MKKLFFILFVGIMTTTFSCKQSNGDKNSVISGDATSEDHYLFDLHNKGLSLLLQPYEKGLRRNYYNSYYPFLLKFLNECQHSYSLNDTLRYSYQNDTIITINRISPNGPIKCYMWSRNDLLYLDGDYIIRGGTLSFSFDEESIKMLTIWDIEKFMNDYNPDNNWGIVDAPDDYISRIVIDNGKITEMDTIIVHAAIYKKEQL